MIGKTVGQSTIELKVPTEQRNCNHCGLEMTCIGHVDHTRLEFYPAHFELLTRRCEKIVCKGCRQNIDVADNITPEDARVRVQA